MANEPRQRTVDSDRETGIATERDMTDEELAKFNADVAAIKAHQESGSSGN
jgi:hypothetical protein